MPHAFRRLRFAFSRPAVWCTAAVLALQLLLLAHALDSRAFPIPVMGKTGTTSDFRDALFVGSTYGPRGVTVAVRMGFDDNRALGEKETGGRTALPIFREIMLRVYQRQLVGPVPSFPREIEDGINEYLVRSAARRAVPDRPSSWPTVE